MPTQQSYPPDQITSWAQARHLPKWLLPLLILAVTFLIFGAALVWLRVENLTVRAVPDASANQEAATHALPTDVRIIAAGWSIVRLIDDWRTDDLATRFTAAAPFIAPRIRTDIKDHFQSLKNTSLSEVAPAKAVIPIAAKILDREEGRVHIALAYDAIDLVESSQGRMSIAHDEISVMTLTLEADAVTDENPFGLLAVDIDRHRGDDYKEKFWGPGAAKGVIR